MPTPILQIPEVSPAQTNKTTTMNDAIMAIESATQDQMSISLGSGDVTLTTAQFIRHAMFVTTSLTAARNLIVPLQKRIFSVRNASATYALTVKGATGATVVIPVSSAAEIQCDGTDCWQLAVGGPGATGPTGPAGSVVSITAGAGLAGGTITSSGTISLETVGPGHLIANTTTGTAVPLDTSLTALLDAVFTGVNQGAVLVRGSSAWQALAPGTNGQALTTAGTTAPPGWVTPSWNGGTVSALGSHLSLTSGTLDAAAPQWNAGTVNAVSGGTIASGTLTITGGTWNTAQIGSVVTLTDAATIATNLAAGNNFQVTIAGNRLLGNPSGISAGQAGQIAVTQGSGGSHTLTYGSYFKFANGTPPVLTTAAGAIDILSYYVIDSTHIALSAGLNFS